MGSLFTYGDKMEEIDNLLPETVMLKLGDETITLTAFKTKHLRMYTRTQRSIARKLTEIGKEMAEELGREPKPDEVPPDVIFDRCLEEFLEQIEVASGKSREWCENLHIDEAFQLAGIINQLNTQRYNAKKPKTLTVVAA